MDSALIQVFLSAGFAGVICFLFIMGWIFPRSVVQDLKEENKELKEALASERDRGDAAMATATTTKDILAAIQLGRKTGANNDP